MSLYKQDGVNLSAGSAFSEYAGQICRQSWENSPFVRIHDNTGGHFRGQRGFSFKNLPPGYYLVGGADGVGTKDIFHAETSSHEAAAHDLVAMISGDEVRHGGILLGFWTILDVATLGEPESATFVSFQRAMNGLGRVAKSEQVVLLGGETAELGVCVGSENPDAVTKFNWGGFGIGVNHPNKIITGGNVRPGQVVLALRENGFRSNGLSAVRSAFRNQFGVEWWKNHKALDAIQAAAAPSTLHGNFFAKANGWYGDRRIPITCIAHITGGGIPEKFFKDCLAPMGLGAHLFDLWTPPTIMQRCAEWRGMEDEECYRVWNGGQGAIAVMEKADVPQFLDLASAHLIQAKVCGTITAHPTLVVHSKFTNKILEYGT